MPKFPLNKRILSLLSKYPNCWIVCHWIILVTWILNLFCHRNVLFFVDETKRLLPKSPIAEPPRNLNDLSPKLPAVKMSCHRNVLSQKVRPINKYAAPIKFYVSSSNLHKLTTTILLQKVYSKFICASKSQRFAFLKVLYSILTNLFVSDFQFLLPILRFVFSEKRRRKN